MHIDFSQKLFDATGEPIFENRLRKDFVGNQPQNSDFELAHVTLLDVAIGALFSTPFQGEQPYTREEKWRQYNLVSLIQSSAQPVDLKSDDVAYIKQKIEKFMHPKIMGAACNAIEPEPKK